MKSFILTIINIVFLFLIISSIIILISVTITFFETSSTKENKTISFVKQDIKQQATPITTINLDEEKQITSSSLHWSSLPIEYKIINNYNNLKLNKRLYDAFNRIANETNNVLTFRENNNCEDCIIITLDDNAIREGRIETLGDANYFYYPDTLEITSATINFYDTYAVKECSYPDTEIHEILHTLGFEHIDNDESIMNEMRESCIQKIDKDIINKLIEIYS